MGIKNPFSKRQGGQQQAASAAPASSSQASSNDSAASSAPSKADTSQINLVNYTPEQLMQQVNADLSGVDLDAAWPVKFKEIFGELWSVLGPLFLFAGTAGEVFFFIWNNTTDQGAWWVALSVLVTVAVLECTFMVVSYQSDTMRNRMRAKAGGASSEDKRDMRNHKIFWFILAAGVATGQIAFLIAAMNAKLGNMPALIAFSVGRSAFTLAGDFYTAFIHKERPTSGERLKARNKQRADLTNDLLRQKAVEVEIINEGTLLLREKHADAIIRDEAKQTELEMKRLENKSRVEALESLASQARMFTDLGSGMIRALVDPKMDESERQKMLGALQGFMSATKHLSPPVDGHIERITEERL